MDPIARLRSLLGIVEDREAVDEIGERVIDRELRALDVAEVLPEAVRKAEREGRLTPSLEVPIEQTLRKSIIRDPQAFADILFPVMGPAIRRSIADTLRAALEGLNRALELGLTARGLRWRLEAWRTGVPFREVVLRHTMAYRVREAFLISKESGLLMARAGEPGSAALDRDAVAAMLTAIEDFVADSTGGGDQDELSSAELGDHVLWVLSGYAARLALVVDGQPPRSVRIRLQEILERIHARFGGWLTSFDGSSAPPAELEAEFASCLVAESLDEGEEASAGRRLLPAILVLSLAALALVGWIVWSVLDNRREASRWARLQALLAQRPGVVYVDSVRRGDVTTVSVLADPAAAPVEDLTVEAGFEPGTLRWNVQRFLSAEPVVVAERLRRALAPVPPGVSIQPGETGVSVAGEAPAAWIERARLYASLQGSPGQIRLGDLREAQGLVERLRAALAPPDGVVIEAVGPGAAAIGGLAGGGWRARAEETLKRDFPSLAVDWSGFVDARARLVEVGRRLGEAAARFGPGQTADPVFEAAETAAIVREIEALAGRCDCRIEFIATGCSDESGPAALNRSVREARAEWLRDALLAELPGAASMALDATCTGTGAVARSAYLRIEVTDR